MADENDNSTDVAAALKSLADTQAALAKGLQAIQEGQNKSSGDLIAAINSLKSTSDDGDDNTDDLDDDDGVDLESMSRKELTSHLTKQFEKRLAQREKAIREEVGTVAHRVDATSIRAEIRDCEDAHADFNEWKTEIGNIVKKYPHIAIEDAYTLAVSKNPTKAKELAEKYKDDKGGKKGKDDADGDGDKGKPAGKKFGGVQPSGRDGSSKSESQSKTVKEEANKVFDELFGDSSN